MKHRRHPNFPSYRFYRDGRIMNRTTGRFLKDDRSYKLINKDGNRQTISKRKILWELFPDLKPKPIKVRKIIPRKRLHRYTPQFIKVIHQAYKQGYNWNEISKRFNIPVGSVNYVMKKIGPITPDIKKVVIYFK